MLITIPLFVLPSGLPAPFCYLACFWIPLSGLAAARVWMLVAARPIPLGHGAGLGAAVGAPVAFGGFALHVHLERLTSTALLSGATGLPEGVARFVLSLNAAQYLVFLSLFAFGLVALGLALGAIGGMIGSVSGRMKS